MRTGIVASLTLCFSLQAQALTLDEARQQGRAGDTFSG